VKCGEGVHPFLPGEEFREGVRPLPRKRWLFSLEMAYFDEF